MPISSSKGGNNDVFSSGLNAVLGRGLSRILAAHYIGISMTFFDQLVAEGKLPPPVKIGARRIWDRYDLDVAFENLKDQEKVTEHNPWDVSS